MNKHAAWMFLLATCTLGCKSVTQRTEPEAQVVSYSPAAQLSAPRPALAQATDPTPHIILARPESARGRDAQSDQVPQNARPAENQSKSTALETDNQTSAVLADARKIVGAIVDAERMILHGLAAMQRVHEGAGEEPMSLAPQPEKIPASSQTPEQGLSTKTVLYCIASIWGTLFTCILAPLVLDFLRQRLGIGRHQPDPNKLLQTQAIEPSQSPIRPQALPPFDWQKQKRAKDLAFLVLVKQLSHKDVRQVSHSGEPVLPAWSSRSVAKPESTQTPSLSASL